MKAASGRYFEGTFCSLPESPCHFVSPIMMKFEFCCCPQCLSDTGGWTNPAAGKNREHCSSSSHSPDFFPFLFVFSLILLCASSCVLLLFVPLKLLQSASDLLFFYNSAFLSLSSLGFNFWLLQVHSE